MALFTAVIASIIAPITYTYISAMEHITAMVYIAAVITHFIIAVIKALLAKDATVFNVCGVILRDKVSAMLAVFI